MEFLILLVFGLIGSIGIHNYILFRKRANILPGILIDYVEKSGNKGTTYSPKVQYINPNNGKIEYFISNFSSSFKSFKIGEEVELLILGRNTDSIKLKWNTPFILFGIFFFIGALGVSLTYTEYGLEYSGIGLGLFLIIHFIVISLFSKEMNKLESKSFEQTITESELNDKFSTMNSEFIEKHNDLEKNKKPKTWSLFSTILGIGFLFASLYMLIDYEKFKESAYTSTATVIDMKQTWSDGDKVYKAVFKYIDNKDKEVVFTDILASNPPSFKKGEEVTVWYDNQNKRYVDRGFWSYSIELFLFLISLMILSREVYIVLKNRKIKRI